MSKQLEVVVIGAGQAGLAMGYHLARQGREFALLDAARTVGDSWRRRWDSLKLFTPAQYSGLPGLPFPAPVDHYPGKDEVADYLELYARTFSLPVWLDEPVLSLTRTPSGRRFVIETSYSRYQAAQVVVATGPFQTPHIPPLAQQLAPEVMQLHSSHYRNPAQLPEGEVLVVGAGNSGVQIAAELAETRRTYLSVGARLPRLPERLLGRSLFWWLDVLGVMEISVETRLGRKASARDLLIGSSPTMVARQRGVRPVARAVEAQGGEIHTSNGQILRPAAVIWATGFQPDFRWIQLPVLDERGRPMHRRGVTAIPGLYFLGLSWLHTRGSGLIGWVGRDAAFLAEQIVQLPVEPKPPVPRPVSPSSATSRISGVAK